MDKCSYFFHSLFLSVHPAPSFVGSFKYIFGVSSCFSLYKSSSYTHVIFSPFSCPRESGMLLFCERAEGERKPSGFRPADKSRRMN